MGGLTFIGAVDQVIFRFYDLHKPIPWTLVYPSYFISGRAAVLV